MNILLRVIEEPVIDVEGNPSETESPVAGSKRPAESPISGPPPKMVALPEIIFKQDSIFKQEGSKEEDSNPFKLKIKVKQKEMFYTKLEKNTIRSRF